MWRFLSVVLVLLPSVGLCETVDAFLKREEWYRGQHYVDELRDLIRDRDLEKEMRHIMKYCTYELSIKQMIPKIEDELLRLEKRYVERRGKTPDVSRLIHKAVRGACVDNYFK